MNINYSIVVPVYNKQNCISRTLNAILDQTYTNFELIIVDDGSTDKSYKEILKFPDNRIHYYYKENGGVSSARNFGIQKAQYDMVCFCDADDVWNNDYLQTLTNLVMKYPKCGMYAMAYKKIFKSGKVENILIEGPGSDFIIHDLCYKKNIYSIQTSGICITKSIITTIGGFRLGIKAGEDLDMWLRVACKYQIAYCKIPKTSYYMDMENNSSSVPLNTHFPYWEWFDYVYSPSASLELLANRRIAFLVKCALINFQFINAYDYLRKIRHKFRFLHYLLTKGLGT